MNSLDREARRHADVVIIGGGVMGVSAAFHLAESGVKNIVLLEKDSLGSGSTSKAAGGVRAQFSDRLNIELGARSLESFRRFGDRPGHEIDLHEVGYLFLLDDSDSVRMFEESVALQNDMGVPSRMISPAEAKVLSPLIDTTGLFAAAFSPTDGHCTPEAVVLGYATAARRLGAQLLTGCSALGIETRDGQIVAVNTSAGRIETDTVICCAGAWSKEVGEWADVSLPVTPLRRQVLVTEPIHCLKPNQPMTLDFSSSFYFHNEGSGLLVGMSDPEEEAGFKLGRSDEWLPRLAEAIEHRAPSLLEAGFASGWAGLYEMTPDHNALIGKASNVDRFFYATGFSGHGFLMGPAIGEILRDLYHERKPYVDISPLDTERFSSADVRPEMFIV